MESCDVYFHIEIIFDQIVQTGLFILRQKVSFCQGKPPHLTERQLKYLPEHLQLFSHRMEQDHQQEHHQEQVQNVQEEGQEQVQKVQEEGQEKALEEGQEKVMEERVRLLHEAEAHPDR